MLKTTRSPEDPTPMNERLASLLDKLRKKRPSSLTDLASKAVRFAGESTSAAVALKDCDSVGPGARAIGGRPIVKNEGRIEIGDELRINSTWSPVELVT